MKFVEKLIFGIVFCVLGAILALSSNNAEKKYDPPMNVNRVIITKKEDIKKEYTVKRVINFTDEYIRLELTDGSQIIGHNYLLEGDTVYIIFSENDRRKDI